MSTSNASENDDFYTQGFEREGYVSVWVGLSPAEADSNLDVLQELCGVGYYRIDDQEGNSFNFEMVELSQLMKDLSFSESFMLTAIEAAKSKGYEQARWIIVQYDFGYDPCRALKQVASDPVFIGSFPYSTAEE